MSIHFDPRSSGVGQPDTETTVIESSASSLTQHRQRKPSWVVPLGLLVGAVSVVGVGMLALDSSSESPQPSPAPALEFTETGTAQRLIQESIDRAAAANDEGQSRRLVQESIDAALAEIGAVTVGSDEGVARRLVQESIDAALAEIAD